MTKMSTRQQTQPYTASWAVWAILIGLGAVEMTYNVYHANHGGMLQPIPATMLGVAPVYAAVLLAHVVAVNDCNRAVRAALFAVMAGAMAVSIGAIAITVAPAMWGGIYGGILFGLVLDGACLTALWVITSKHQQQAAEATELDSARAAASAAAGQAQQSAAEAAELRDQLELMRAELATATGRAEGLGSADERAREVSAEAARLRDELASTQAMLATAQGEVTGLRDASERAGQAAAETAEVRGQLGDVQAELAAVRAELQAVRDAERERRRRGTGGGTKRRSTAGTRSGTKPRTGGGTDDLSIEFRAMEILAQEPTLNGTELAERLEVTPGYGRRLRRQLAARDGEPAES